MSPKPIPLRVLLVATFVLQTVTAVGLTVWLSWRSEQQSIAELNLRLQTESFNNLQAQLNRYLDASTIINQLNAEALTDQVVSLKEPTQLTCQFWQQRSLFSAPVTAIYAGGADGRFSGLELHSNQSWRLGRVGTETKGSFYSYAVNAQGQATRLLRRGKTYDPRRQPWYRQAIQGSQPVWSKVYRDPNGQQLKLTLSQPVYAPNRQLIGVVGVDFALTQLSAFLRSLHTQNFAALAIIDPDGKVVATSTGDRPYTVDRGVPQPLNFAALKNPLFNALAPQLKRILQQPFVAGKPMSQTVQVQGQSRSLWVAPLQDKYKLNLWIVGVVSEPNLIQSMPNHSRETLLLCLVVLMTAILLGLITARKLSQGLQQLIRGGQAIARGNLDQAFPNSFIDELSQLSDTFNRMAGHLRQSFDELEARVQNRTAALKKSEEKFAKTFYHHPNPVTISRLRDGCFIDANDSALKLLGVEREVLVGHTSAELDVCLDPSHREQVLQHITNHHSVREIESTLRTRSGDLKTILCSADVIDLDGEPHLISIVQDITDRKKVEEALRRSEEKFAKFFHSNPNPITISRVSDGCFVDANGGAIAFLEADWDEVIGKTSYELQIWVDLQDREQILEILQARQAVRGQECRLRTRSGAIRTVLYSAELIEMGGQICLISTLNDISDRRQAEEDLQRAKVQAEEANRAKSLFFSKMSHELRTPLNAILGFAQVLNLDESLCSRQKEQLDIISRSGEHLLEMINEVLDIAKIEAGRVEVNVSLFDLHRCLETLKAMFALKAAGKGVSLLLDKAEDVPQFIKTDEGKLRQILMNLLSNAVKFTEIGYVLLRVRIENHSGSASAQTMLCFDIEDTGSGIALSELDEIFDAFVQSKLNHTPYVGTGLGLTICREFVRLLGGEISVSSTLGKGTLFQFYIPLHVSHELASGLKGTYSVLDSQVAHRDPTQSPYRLLVADDRYETRQHLVRLLESLGFDLREAESGDAAIELWSQWEPHLVWMGQAPLQAGYAMKLKFEAQLKERPAIIIGLIDSIAEEATALGSGCDGILHQPCEESVRKTLAQYLGIRWTQDLRKSSSMTSRVLGLDELAKSGQSCRILTSEYFRDLPIEWIRQVHQAAQAVNNVALYQLINQIPETHAVLAGTLNYLVQNFRCDMIFEVTEKLV
jgi:PAS domain S-box-containing protein